MLKDLIPNDRSIWLRSDNAAGAHPEIISAIQACNDGDAMPYGDDDLSQALDTQFSAFFKKQVKVFPVSSGTAANALALASIAGPFDLILGHEEAHAFASECGAMEFFSSGGRSMPIPGDHGRIDLESAATRLDSLDDGRGNSYRPAALTVTQLTEAGTAYSPARLRELQTFAVRYGLRIHMDGARFANALAFLDVGPDEITWKVGVDVLSFGATKNGTMYADAVVFFDEALAVDFKRRRKRSGHDLSKSRFLAAQLLRYLEGDLWLQNARHANSVAQDIAAMLSRVPGATILHPVEGNIVFVALPQQSVLDLATAGIRLRSKGQLSDGRELFRLVPSFDTDAAKARAVFERLIR